MRIAIIGLGWLGLPLASQFLKKEHLISGSTTSTEKIELLSNSPINTYKIVLSEDHIDGDIDGCLANCDILILNTPPGLRRNPKSNYVAKIQRLIPYIEKSNITKVLYVSSTSVFKDNFPFSAITNTTQPNATTNAGVQIRKVENLLKSNPSFDTTILRFAGLIADDRHPAKMMSRRENIPNSQAPVNLIHRNDCIGIIEKIIEQEAWGVTLNASYPEHPNKKEYYTEICTRMGYNLPDFSEGALSNGKIIDGSTIEKIINYNYQYPIW